MRLGVLNCRRCGRRRRFGGVFTTHSDMSVILIWRRAAVCCHRDGDDDDDGCLSTSVLTPEIRACQVDGHSAD